jgi:alanine racemase
MDRSVVTEPPAWVEVDLAQLRRNWDAIARYCPAGVGIACVVKDDAYGHGALPLAEIALECGAEMLVVASVTEALELRQGGIEGAILILGERNRDEYAVCLQHDFAVCVGSHAALAELSRAVQVLGRAIPIHLKIDTGMSRYGFRWSEADELFSALRKSPEIVLEGIMSHFAMSDELDKTFANLQLARFKQVLSSAEKPMRNGVIPVGYGFGYPRVRNQGHVLIHGQRAPLIGGVSMDAITVDVTDIIEAKQWDEVTLLGRNDQDEITIHDIAALRNSVSYDAMVSWSARLPRRYLQ